MTRVMVSWIGYTDLDAAAGKEGIGAGPVAQALSKREYDEVVFISDHKKERAGLYLEWLAEQPKLGSPAIRVEYRELTGPMNFGEIYQIARDVVRGVCKAHGDGLQLTFHLSPGSPAMAAVWILLGKTMFPAELIESSKQAGVKTAEIPFDIAADFIPDLQSSSDARIADQTSGLPPEAPEFGDIFHRSPEMERVIAMARRAAVRAVSVLIQGESGTGKELLARAIHEASPRQGKFQPVNCGAIPPELVESELFGHEKGVYTDAKTARKGHFEEAHQGTLFLDEIGELPLAAQVKLLRVLQEGEVTPLGAREPVQVDVRVIAATNRDLVADVAEGRFRADLFYRLAVAVINLPPLRERQGDLSLLIDRLLEQINKKERAADASFPEKQLSAAARNVLLGHSWPGNVRELVNTLHRAVIWSAEATITTDDARNSLLPMAPPAPDELLNKPLGEGLNVRELIATLERHYLTRALEETDGNKTKAAELIGLGNQTTFTNWLKRNGLE